MIWDKIISDYDKLRPYLNFISDQEDSLEMAKKKISIVKGELHKRPVAVAKNAVNFLSSLSGEQVTGMISKIDWMLFQELGS